MRLLLIGDVMVGRLVNEALRRQTADYPWGDTIERIQAARWRACNLECVLSARTVPAFPDKAFHFRSEPGNVAVLEAAGIDAVSVANNHVLDFGEEALLEMLEVLEAAGIDHAGAGRNLDEACRPAIRELDGCRVGLLACTDNEPAWAAGESRPGIFYVPAEPDSVPVRERLLPVVREARRQVDVLVVSLHWGPNWGYTPPSAHRMLGRALVEAGADVVFGHSGHVFRGVEVHRGRPIIYCAGDFIDDYAVDKVERNDQSLIFQVEWEAASFQSLRLWPTLISDLQALLARGSAADEILQKMEQLCAALGTRMQRGGSEGLIDLAG